MNIFTKTNSTYFYKKQMSAEEETKVACEEALKEEVEKIFGVKNQSNFAQKRQNHQNQSNFNVFFKISLKNHHKCNVLP